MLSESIVLPELLAPVAAALTCSHNNFCGSSAMFAVQPCKLCHCSYCELPAEFVCSHSRLSVILLEAVVALLFTLYLNQCGKDVSKQLVGYRIVTLLKCVCM